MATDCITQLRFEGDRFPKPIVVAFDQECSSADGGLILLQALDAKLGLTDALAACLHDRRQPGKIQHPLVDLLRQRVFGLAAGYADCNDAARLANDPMHKLALGRDPLDGAPLGSQPTLSRFENAVTRPALGRMLHVLADTVIASQRRRLGRRRVRRITIDLDVTDDPTHGQQEFAFFSGHYGCWHYLPLLATLTFDHDPEQYLVGAILRPGNAGADGTVGWVRRLVRKLRRAFPRARLRVRLDGGFAGNPLLDFLEASGLEYVVALARNSRLERLAARWLDRARHRATMTGEAVQLFGATRYAAKTWSRRRRVIIKAEVLPYPDREPKDNPRFVVTNLTAAPAHVYHVYRQRGDVENRIKELKYGLAIDRTSCSRFRANAFRVILTVAAYILLQELRRRARTTGGGTAQVGTLRERLLKIGAWVERSVRRVVVHLPASFPWLPTWRRLACSVGATP
ncbi:MAG TPA: IS1380 family transposase [Vicinamibacterales bacterium]|nr:IS1380 family transposase [Vicinamibacterales bacterium]